MGVYTTNHSKYQRFSIESKGLGETPDTKKPTNSQSINYEIPDVLGHHPISIIYVAVCLKAKSCYSPSTWCLNPFCSQGFTHCILIK